MWLVGDATAHSITIHIKDSFLLTSDSLSNVVKSWLVPSEPAWGKLVQPIGWLTWDHPDRFHYSGPTEGVISTSDFYPRNDADPRYSSWVASNPHVEMESSTRVYCLRDSEALLRAMFAMLYKVRTEQLVFNPTRYVSMASMSKSLLLQAHPISRGSSKADRDALKASVKQLTELAKSLDKVLSSSGAPDWLTGTDVIGHLHWMHAWERRMEPQVGRHSLGWNTHSVVNTDFRSRVESFRPGFLAGLAAEYGSSVASLTDRFVDAARSTAFGSKSSMQAAYVDHCFYTPFGCPDWSMVPELFGKLTPDEYEFVKMGYSGGITRPMAPKWELSPAKPCALPVEALVAKAGLRAWCSAHNVEIGDIHVVSNAGRLSRELGLPRDAPIKDIVAALASYCDNHVPLDHAVMKRLAPLASRYLAEECRGRDMTEPSMWPDMVTWLRAADPSLLHAAEEGRSEPAIELAHRIHPYTHAVGGAPVPAIWAYIGLAMVGVERGHMDTLLEMDIHSSYPASMGLSMLPHGRPTHHKVCSDLQVFADTLGGVNSPKFRDAFHGFYTVQYTVPDDCHGLPLLMDLRHGTSGTGVGTSVGYSEELIAAMASGYKVYVFEGLRFPRGCVMRDFANKLYDQRLAIKEQMRPLKEALMQLDGAGITDTPLHTKNTHDLGVLNSQSWVLKNYLNPVYGSLSMPYIHTESVLMDAASMDTLKDLFDLKSDVPLAGSHGLTHMVTVDISKANLTVTDSELDRIMGSMPPNIRRHRKLLGDGRSPNAAVDHQLSQNINIAVGAAITALSRVRIYEYIQALAKEGCRPYYCDTDSVHFTLPAKRGFSGDLSTLASRTSSMEALQNHFVVPDWLPATVSNRLGYMGIEESAPAISATFSGRKSYNENYLRYIDLEASRVEASAKSGTNRHVGLSAGKHLTLNKKMRLKGIPNVLLSESTYLRMYEAPGHLEEFTFDKLVRAISGKVHQHINSTRSARAVGIERHVSSILNPWEAYTPK